MPRSMSALKAGGVGDEPGRVRGAAASVEGATHDCRVGLGGSDAAVDLDVCQHPLGVLVGVDPSRSTR